MKNNIKKIITYGTFDLFHIGHVRLLKRIRDLGDYLIVGCSTESFNKKKGKKSIFSYSERSEILQACKYVDEVIPENDWEQKYNDIKKFKVDLFVMGDDWVGEFDNLQDICKVIYLPRTKGISTTEIKELSASFRNDRLIEIKKLTHKLSELVDEF